MIEGVIRHRWKCEFGVCLKKKPSTTTPGWNRYAVENNLGKSARLLPKYMDVVSCCVYPLITPAETSVPLVACGENGWERRGAVGKATSGAGVTEMKIKLLI